MILKNLSYLSILIAFINCHTSYSIEIKCNFLKFYWAALDRHEYTCDGTALFIDDNTFVTNITRPNSIVRGLVIAHQRGLTKFPSGIGNYFQNLLGIDLEGCGIDEISSDDLKPFSDLIQISLDENKLTELPSDLFRYNTKLKRIDIEGNTLLHVGLDIFMQLQHLQVVYMKHNTCTSGTTYALTNNDIKELAWELTVECPPTLSMLTTSLLSDKNFEESIRKISSKHCKDIRGEIMREVKNLERKIQDLKRML